MAKVKTSLLSLKAHGSLGNAITYQDRNLGTMARKKPFPTDPQSLAQIYQRWDYQDYAALWHTLSAADKQQWETDARRLRITGFNYWMRTKLTTLPDIVGRWRLDERTGVIARDSSKNANNGTIFGAQHVKGIIDYGLSFDGLDDYVLVPDSDTLRGMDELTIEVFTYLTAIVEVSNFVSKWAGGAVQYMLGWIQINGQYRFYVGDDTNQAHVTANTLLVPGNLYHVAGVYKKGVSLKIYLNGIEDGSNPSPPNWTIGTAAVDLNLGRYPGYTIEGLEDHIIIRDRALSLSDIKRHSERRYPL